MPTGLILGEKSTKKTLKTTQRMRKEVYPINRKTVTKFIFFNLMRLPTRHSRVSSWLVNDVYTSFDMLLVPILIFSGRKLL